MTTTNELSQTIGAAVRAAREALNLSQAMAAHGIGVGVEFLQNVEAGKTLPSMIIFARIVATLGVSADVLIGNPIQPQIAQLQTTNSTLRGIIEDRDLVLAKLVAQLVAINEPNIGVCEACGGSGGLEDPCIECDP
jgi:transcriptional regulator with XRE-family HTH domain